MGTEEVEPVTQLNQMIIQNMKCFLTEVAKLEELGSVGGRFLDGFRQSLEFIRRPPVVQSQLIESIIKANETRRLKWYLESGCVNNHERVQNMSKLQTCLLGLQDHLAKAKTILTEIEERLEDLGRQIQAAHGWLLLMINKDTDEQLDQGIAACQELTSSKHEELQMTDYAAMMAIVYSMVKQDHMMQERIITSLNLKTTSGELETYSLMWSLRPFVDDGTMHQAWKLF